MKFLKLVVIIALVAGGFMIYRFFSEGEKSKTMNPDVGVVGDKLKPCGPKPNCVCSFSDPSTNQYVMPLQMKDNPIPRVMDVLKQQGLKIIEAQPNYIWATETSKIFKFVDDIEFYYTNGVLHVRSASRVGYSDLGANKRRVEKLFSLF